MGKKKDKGETSEHDELHISKKSKKHKHKKSSKKEEINVVDFEEFEDFDDASSSAVKLKMKLNESLSPEKISGLNKSSKTKVKEKKSSSSKKSSGKKKDGKGEDETDSEEERWLDAIESGKLEEVDDELKQIKNPRLLTARQRAMIEKRADVPDEHYPVIPAEPLLSLPSGFKEKVVTEEMLAKKAIKTLKRREQAQEKREEDKKKTVDRLLRKQDPKNLGKSSRAKSSKQSTPMVSYIKNADFLAISYPIGIAFPLLPQKEKPPPSSQYCGAPGCRNIKKYSCSKTGIPLCSLRCYKINIRKFGT